MKLLVTGGTGFLGRHVVAAARAAGHAAAVLCRAPERAAGLPEGTEVVLAELTDGEALQAALDRAAPEAVIHAAAVVANHDPRLLGVNVGGTRLLCERLAEGRPGPRIVLVSSFAVEDIPPTAYSESKVAAEEVVRTSGLPWVVVRPGLIYGPGDTSNGPRLVRTMRAGTRWLPAGGTTRIQPVFVEDAARALVAAAVEPAAVGHTYRLGGPEPISVRAWREAVRDATGGTARIRAIPLPLFALAARLGALVGRRSALGVLDFHLADHAVDSEAARADLGFRPRPYAEGLAATYGPAD